MSYGIKLKVWGDYASFNRPEMKVERVSYDMITPSAARGMLEAIYWKPGFRWVIDELRVLAPIRFTSVRRNEISAKIPTTGIGKAMKGEMAEIGIVVEDYRQQRAGLILRDVCFGIAAHINILRPDVDAEGKPLASPEVKHLVTFKRRAGKGQFYHQPCLGCREFPANCELVEEFGKCPDELMGLRPLGMMLWDMDFEPNKEGSVIESNEGKRMSVTPLFFSAVLNDGVLKVPSYNQVKEGL